MDAEGGGRRTEGDAGLNGTAGESGCNWGDLRTFSPEDNLSFLYPPDDLIANRVQFTPSDPDLSGERTTEE